jgi:hypothetical protein
MKMRGSFGCAGVLAVGALGLLTLVLLALDVTGWVNARRTGKPSGKSGH